MQKGFFDYEFNSADIDKISNFNEIASNFTYLCTSKFIKYNLTDTDHLLLKSKFYGRGKSGMYFCISGSCQPLTVATGKNEKEYSWHVPSIKFTGMKQLVSKTANILEKLRNLWKWEIWGNIVKIWYFVNNFLIEARI